MAVPGASSLTVLAYRATETAHQDARDLSSGFYWERGRGATERKLVGGGKAGGSTEWKRAGGAGDTDWKRGDQG
ncbi:hypothetical protein BC835DRAFT_1318220, partial [Cytidiella melzeri]